MRNSAFKADISYLSLKKGLDMYPNASFTPHDEDSIERLTVLGSQLPNPYLIPNMRQAYLNLGYDPDRATVNNLYVRFLAGTSQLPVLDSLMDSQGYELFDTPMDYEVLSEGDYYQDPSIPDSLPTWQYAVVAPGFVPPSGITYQVLAQIHIPPDDFTAVETEAENIAGGGLQFQPNNMNPNVLQCDPGYHWDYNLKKCVPNFCEDGYHWDNGQQKCVPNSCPPGYYWDNQQGYCRAYNTNPPPPAADASIPAGYIKVHDTNLNSDVPVRKARVVAKRWFKISRIYTDNNGYFNANKKFKNKVKVNVKFKNDDAEVRNVRGIRFWQMVLPVTKTLGVFSGDKSSISYTFIQYSDYSAKGNIYWTAATVHNAVQEYKDYAGTEHIGLPPQGLKIFISKNGLVGAGGSTPMFAKRVINNISTAFVTSYLSPLVAYVIAVVKSQLDMVIGYKYTTGSSLDITQLLSDRIKETTYHELTHSAHYTALGNTWYTTFVTAEEYEIVANLSSGYSPYGDGTNSTFSPIIALGESWAYYMGHYLADQRYGANASQTSEQTGPDGFGIAFTPNGTNHPHQLVEENFNPNLSSDPFKWIPQGLFYDLWDPANEIRPTTGPVTDAVSGFTNAQMFNAFQSGIYTLQDYRLKLIQQNPTNPTISQVTNLFTEYHY